MKQFLEGKRRRAFLLGKPGTGKSYKLFNEYIPAFLAAQPGKSVAILAFTNKAVGVVEEYAAQFGYVNHPLIKITTIHKFAKLRPALNESATRMRDLHLTQKHGDCTEAHLVVIDEVGTVGDELGDALDNAYLENCFEQLLLLGDYQQLKPINGDAYYHPEKGDPVVYLDEIKRTDKPDVAAVITELHDLIRDGSPRRYKLKESENIVKGMPVAPELRDEVTVIAWRNQTVQDHNANMMGREDPQIGDEVYCDTMKEVMKVKDKCSMAWLEDYSIQRTTAVKHDKYGAKLKADDPARYKMNDDTDKYYTRRRFYGQILPRIVAEGTATGRMHLLEMETDGDEQFHTVALFGIAAYRETMAALLETALQANREMLASYELTEVKEKRKRARSGESKVKPVANKAGKEWINLKAFIEHEIIGLDRDEWSDEIKEWKAAWGTYATAKEIVFCVDFNRARTCHSLQGSSLPTVFIDVDDFRGCRNQDDANRLLYVGVSRSRGKVYF